MTPQTGGHSGNALTPHDVLRRDVLRHARAAYRHAMERVPVDEAPENLKLAAASTPRDQEDDDQDKAALWLRSGTDAAATADEAAKAGVMFTEGQAAGAASSVTQGTAASAGAAAEASAAVGTASAAGAMASAGSTLLGSSILGAFAVAAGANLQDSGPLLNVSARNRLSTGRDSSREDANTGTEGQSSAAAPSAGAAPLATGTASTAPSRPTNEGTQAEASRTPTSADAAAAPAESAAPSVPEAPATSTTDASKPAEGDGNAMPQAKPLPTYSENASVSYAHGENKALGAAVFSGTNEETAPSFVRIMAIQGKDGEAATGTMSLLGGNAIVPNQIISRADFDKVVWDASKNEGGSFKFIPGQEAQGTALPGAIEQTVSINEAKPLFHIAAENFDLLDAYPDRVNEHPAYVKVTNIVEANDTNGILDALVLGEDGGTVLKVGDIIRAEDFGRVYWNYASNDGGEIFLATYNAEGRLIDPGRYSMELEPSWKTPAGATALPTYKADVSLDYAFNESKAVGDGIFNGTDSKTAPAFVRITAIQGKDGEDAASTMSLKDGEALTVGSVVSRADFDKVVWDASKNEGGSFKFIPVQDAQGTALPGAVEQTVSINEAKPLFHIPAGYFDPAGEHPAYVKVTNFTEANDTNGILDALVLGEDGGTQLKVGDVIRAEDFGRVYWNHASNDGGEIFLTPYNANDRMVDPGPYSMELEPSWKTPDKKSLPLPHDEREATDASLEPVGVAHPATDGLMPLGAQAQYPGMTPLAMSSPALLDSLLEQHPGTTGLL